MSKLEIALLVGPEAKSFLASLTKQIDRIEQLSAKDALAMDADKKKKPAKKVEEDDEEETDEDEEKETDDDADETEEDDSDDDADTDDDSEDEEESDDDEEKEEKKPAKKSASKKKIALSDVKDACKAYMRKHDRKAVMKVLKKFKVESTEDLEQEQYAEVIKALAV